MRILVYLVVLLVGASAQAKKNIPESKLEREARRMWSAAKAAPSAPTGARAEHIRYTTDGHVRWTNRRGPTKEVTVYRTGKSSMTVSKTLIFGRDPRVNVVRSWDSSGDMLATIKRPGHRPRYLLMRQGGSLVGHYVPLSKARQIIQRNGRFQPLPGAGSRAPTPVRR